MVNLPGVERRTWIRPGSQVTAKAVSTHPAGSDRTIAKSAPWSRPGAASPRLSRESGNPCGFGAVMAAIGKQAGDSQLFRLEGSSHGRQLNAKKLTKCGILCHLRLAMGVLTAGLDVFLCYRVPILCHLCAGFDALWRACLSAKSGAGNSGGATQGWLMIMVG